MVHLFRSACANVNDLAKSLSLITEIGHWKGNFAQILMHILIIRMNFMLDEQ